MKRINVLVLIAVWLLPLAGRAGNEAMAQSIRGTVYDPDGGVVAKAKVMLMQDYVKLKETVADERGGFAFVDLAPGRYQVQIKQPMFSLFQQTIDLKETESASIYAILPLGRLSDGMQISARLAPTVQRNPALAQGTLRAGGRIDMAKLLEFPLPGYPPGPDSKGVEGDVVIFATVRTDGRVADPVIISSPDREFDEDAIAAVRKWRYRPMQLNGHAVDAQVMITLQYRLR